MYKKIRCPFYEEMRVRYCKAFEKRILVPKGEGEERYCTCNDYIDCPVYIEYRKRKSEEKLNLDNIRLDEDKG